MATSETEGLKVAVELDDLLELARLAKQAGIRDLVREKVSGADLDATAMLEAASKIERAAGEDLGRQEAAILARRKGTA